MGRESLESRCFVFVFVFMCVVCAFDFSQSAWNDATHLIVFNQQFPTSNVSTTQQERFVICWHSWQSCITLKVLNQIRRHREIERVSVFEENVSRNQNFVLCDLVWVKMLFIRFFGLCHRLLPFVTLLFSPFYGLAIQIDHIWIHEFILHSQNWHTGSPSLLPTPFSFSSCRIRILSHLFVIIDIPLHFCISIFVSFLLFQKFCSRWHVQVSKLCVAISYAEQ